MIVEKDRDNITRTVYLEPTDECYECENKYGCPLIECLNRGLVFTKYNLDIKECPHYYK